jgi:hypothetical protein
MREYFDANAAGWSPVHRSDFLRSFKHASALNPLPISAVDESLVLGVLQPIWNTTTNGETPTAADRRCFGLRDHRQVSQRS